MMQYHQIEFQVHERQRTFLDEAALHRLLKELPASPRHQHWSVRFVIQWFSSHNHGRWIDLRFWRSRLQRGSG